MPLTIFLLCQSESKEKKRSIQKNLTGKSLTTGLFTEVWSVLEELKKNGETQ